MKKKLLILIILILLIVGGFALYKYTNSRPEDNKAKSEHELITESLDKYYLKINHQKKTEFKIYNTKKLDDKYLVLAEGAVSEGERVSKLFLLNNKFDILKVTYGHIPISQCFSINKVIYENKTISFGNFNNSKINENADKKIPVDIKKIEIKFEDGTSVQESVSVDNGYILISNTVSDINDVILYNNNNEIQSNLSDLGINGRIQNKSLWDVSPN